MGGLWEDLVVSETSGTPICSHIYYSPAYWDTANVTLMLGNPPILGGPIVRTALGRLGKLLHGDSGVVCAIVSVLAVANTRIYIRGLGFRA